MSTKRTTQTSTNHNPHYDPDYGLASKALRFAEKANAAEQILVDALPEIMQKMVSMAKAGNVPASRYLLDRIYGKAARLSIPAFADLSLAYTGRDWGKANYLEELKREEVRRSLFRPRTTALEDSLPFREGVRVGKD